MLSRSTFVVLATLAAAGCNDVSMDSSEGPTQITCSDDVPVGCPLIEHYGMSVVVKDSSTGERICDAVVTVHHEDGEETLKGGVVAGDGCYRSGLLNCWGVVSLSVVAKNYTTVVVEPVKVTRGTCGPKTTSLVVELTMEGDD